MHDLTARYLSGAARDALDPILDACVEVYKHGLDGDAQIEFKTRARAFVRSYQFLVMILPFKNPYWESLRIFLKLLLPKLPAPDDEDLARGLIESVDMDSYRAEQQTTIAIKLQAAGELQPAPANMAAFRETPQMEYLSNIVREFNERWGTHWTDADKIRRFLFEDLPADVAKDEEYRNARQHSDRQNARITHERKVTDAFQNIIFDQTALYRLYTDNDEFRRWLLEALFRMDYERVEG